VVERITLKIHAYKALDMSGDLEASYPGCFLCGFTHFL
jgi:hypothetical protein